MEYNCLQQRKVLEPLCVGLVAIELVSTEFLAHSSGTVNQRSNYFAKVGAPVFPEEKEIV